MGDFNAVLDPVLDSNANRPASVDLTPGYPCQVWLTYGIGSTLMSRPIPIFIT